MTMKPSKPPVWVDSTAAMEKMVSSFQNLDLLAVDMESNGLFAYQEEVCLIQFSTGTEDYLVDPFAFSNLDLLGEVFLNPAIEKIFHAAEYDLISMKRDYGIECQNLFDTMLAGRILAKKGLGLASMLKEYFNVDVDKRFQRANWGKRPLSPEQLVYARMDTFYLISLRNHLRAELIEKDMMVLAEEDFKRGCNVQCVNGDSIESVVWKVAGRHDVSPRQAAVLKELCLFREEHAKQLNRPVFKVMGNKTLLQIAQDMPQSVHELQDLDLVTSRQVKTFGDSLLRAVQKGLQAELLYRPNHRMPDQRFLERLDELKIWRKETARSIGVESDIVMPRDVLELIARKNPMDMDSLKDVMQEVPWRYNKFGNVIMDLLNQLEGV